MHQSFRGAGDLVRQCVRLLAQPGVSAPIVGATRLAQLDDAAAALELALSPADIAELQAPYVPHAVVGHA